MHITAKQTIYTSYPILCPVSPFPPVPPAHPSSNSSSTSARAKSIQSTEAHKLVKIHTSSFASGPRAPVGPVKRGVDGEGRVAHSGVVHPLFEPDTLVREPRSKTDLRELRARGGEGVEEGLRWVEAGCRKSEMQEFLSASGEEFEQGRLREVPRLGSVEPLERRVGDEGAGVRWCPVSLPDKATDLTVGEYPQALERGELRASAKEHLENLLCGHNRASFDSCCQVKARSFGHWSAKNFSSIESLCLLLRYAFSGAITTAALLKQLAGWAEPEAANERGSMEDPLALAFGELPCGAQDAVENLKNALGIGATGGFAGPLRDDDGGHFRLL
ncbi:hypothetical protein BDK51DRAFT_28319 [Blyttiomyces helicus]|uniref:Uncharacterized protein n=1 Tax=Blyttiomyces helicus TaxID=388810 RepID=A0A4P9WLJ5_9FUNG|nr:hypothetical protein BDK51DRAFT_28319 [Blyttiomyces helicus]|eukprot:RKO92498.1 hypothetical protein BDK51DRAFT_28319 [Blyttiomyces helicus]